MRDRDARPSPTPTGWPRATAFDGPAQLPRAPTPPISPVNRTRITIAHMRAASRRLLVLVAVRLPVPRFVIWAHAGPMFRQLSALARYASGIRLTLLPEPLLALHLVDLLPAGPNGPRQTRSSHDRYRWAESLRPRLPYVLASNLFLEADSNVSRYLRVMPGDYRCFCIQRKPNSAFSAAPRGPVRRR
mgnify:CR=1 FL=1